MKYNHKGRLFGGRWSGLKVIVSHIFHFYNCRFNVKVCRLHSNKPSVQLLVCILSVVLKSICIGTMHFKQRNEKDTNLAVSSFHTVCKQTGTCCAHHKDAKTNSKALENRVLLQSRYFEGETFTAKCSNTKCFCFSEINYPAFPREIQ